MKSQDNNCVIYRFRQACIRKFDGNVHWLCGTWDYVRDRPRIQDMHKGSRKADDDNVIAQLGPLRRYAQSLTRDAAQAEDLVHDTLLRAYEHRSAFRAGGNMRSWLLSIQPQRGPNRCAKPTGSGVGLNSDSRAAEGHTALPQPSPKEASATGECCERGNVEP